MIHTPSEINLKFHEKDDNNLKLIEFLKNFGYDSKKLLQSDRNLYKSLTVQYSELLLNMLKNNYSGIVSF